MENGPINYAALANKKLSHKNFTKEQLVAAGLRKWHMNNIVLVVMILIALIWLFISFANIMMFVAMGNLSDGGGLVMMAGGLIVPLLIFTTLLLMVRFAGRERFRLLRFALDNGWRANFSGIKDFSASPLLFQQGHSQTVNYWLETPREKWLFANYQYTVNHGEGSTTYYFDFAQISLPRHVPHLIINSRKNNISAPTFGYDVKKIQVEGDFNKAFTIIAPPEYERDALQILTPDVLSALMDFGTAFDFEMLDNKLFVFAPKGTITNDTKMRGLVTAITQISPEISHQVKHYSDDKAEQMVVSEDGTITAASAHSLISSKGMRLKQKRWVGIATAIIVVVFVILQIIFEFWRSN